MAIFCLLAVPAGAQPARADVGTLTGHFVVGFQGWFMCPHDGRPVGGWWHWFTANRPDAAHAHFDLLPDTRELTPRERCPTGLRGPDGRPVELFSDQRPQTVLRQFAWMRQYGIDSVALQRFVVDFDPVRPVIGRPAIDRVLANARQAAEATGRGLFVMYDIAGADPARWAADLARDWQDLLAGGLTRSLAYQRHRGHPVLAIAGVGANDRPGTAAEMLALVATLRRESEPFGGVTLLASTATGWRTLDGDAKREPDWARAYRAFDVISPWTVGRYRDSASFARFRAERLVPDMAEARRAGMDYLPVVFPGFSRSNLYRSTGRSPQTRDAIPRLCGRFLWMQAAGDVHAGAGMLYGAMFDEVDEGTALFKLVADPARLPEQPPLVALNSAGCHVPGDWYLRISGRIADLLSGRIPPSPSLPLETPSAE